MKISTLTICAYNSIKIMLLRSNVQMLFRSNEARTLFLISGKKLCRQTEPCLGTLLLALGAWTKWAIVFAIKAAWIHRQFGGGERSAHSFFLPLFLPHLPLSFSPSVSLSLSLFLLYACLSCSLGRLHHLRLSITPTATNFISRLKRPWRKYRCWMTTVWTFSRNLQHSIPPHP